MTTKDIKMNQQQQFNTWYNNGRVLQQMIKHLQNREFALLEPKHLLHTPPRNTRNMRAHNTQAIQFILFRMLKCHERMTVYNLYYSTSTYINGLPYSNPNLAERNLDDWKENYWKDISAVDLLLDIDAPSHEEIEYAVLDTIRIANDLKIKGKEFEIRFTGCGFHIIIPGYSVHAETTLSTGNCVFPYMNNENSIGKQVLHPTLPLKNFKPFSDGNVWEELSRIAGYYEDNFSELVDSSLNDSRRIIKIPYSLSFYEKETYVCSPITMEELKEFELVNYCYDNYNLNMLKVIS